MKNDNAGSWGPPGVISDSLTDLLRRGARGLIETAVEAELALLLDEYRNVTDLQGRRAVVRNGYLPERDILTGVGNIPVRLPKVRDRSGSGIKFIHGRSRYARREVRCWSVKLQPYIRPFYGLLAWPQWNTLDNSIATRRALGALHLSGLVIHGLTCSAI